MTPLPKGSTEDSDGNKRSPEAQKVLEDSNFVEKSLAVKGKKDASAWSNAIDVTLKNLESAGIKPGKVNTSAVGVGNAPTDKDFAAQAAFDLQTISRGLKSGALKVTPEVIAKMQELQGKIGPFMPSVRNK